MYCGTTAWPGFPSSPFQGGCVGRFLPGQMDCVPGFPFSPAVVVWWRWGCSYWPSCSCYVCCLPGPPSSPPLPWGGGELLLAGRTMCLVSSFLGLLWSGLGIEACWLSHATGVLLCCEAHPTSPCCARPASWLGFQLGWPGGRPSGYPWGSLGCSG